MKEFLIYILIAVGLLGYWVFKSHSEMETFNKFTHGEKATLRDAMFSELRILAE